MMQVFLIKIKIYSHKSLYPYLETSLVFFYLSYKVPLDIQECKDSNKFNLISTL